MKFKDKDGAEIACDHMMTRSALDLFSIPISRQKSGERKTFPRRHLIDFPQAKKIDMVPFRKFLRVFVKFPHV